MINSAKALNRASILGAVAIGLTCAAGAASASAADFNFRAVEYVAQNQGEAAADALVAQNVRPGMPVAAAVAVLQKAGTACATQGGEISCSFTSAEQSPDTNLHDVTWTVRIAPTADQTVASASVERVETGS